MLYVLMVTSPGDVSVCVQAIVEINMGPLLNLLSQQPTWTIIPSS